MRPSSNGACIRPCQTVRTVGYGVRKRAMPDCSYSRQWRTLSAMPDGRGRSAMANANGHAGLFVQSAMAYARGPCRTARPSNNGGCKVPCQTDAAVQQWRMLTAMRDCYTVGNGVRKRPCLTDAAVQQWRMQMAMPDCWCRSRAMSYTEGHAGPRMRPSSNGAECNYPAGSRAAYRPSLEGAQRDLGLLIRAPGGP